MFTNIFEKPVTRPKPPTHKLSRASHLTITFRGGEKFSLCRPCTGAEDVYKVWDDFYKQFRNTKVAIITLKQNDEEREICFRKSYVCMYDTRLLTVTTMA